MIFRPTVLMERVSRWAELQPGAFSKKNAEDDVHGKGQHVRHAVDVLLAEGYLEPSGDRYRHVRPYRQDDDPEAENHGDEVGGSSRGSSREEEPKETAPPSSPRPASNHAGSRGSSHPQGRGRPEAVGGGSSPSSPTRKGGTGRASGEERLRLVIDDQPGDNWCARCERVLEATRPGEPRCHCADPDRGTS